MFKLATVASFLLASALPALTSGNTHAARADTASCPALPPSTGGRKIGIVIDSSGSNSQTDPNNLRIVAGKSFNSALITAAKAGPSGKADLVTVVDFDGSASVIYPLGDPAGASPSFDTIDSSGSTDIASGVKAAIDELTKNPQDPTAHRTGIIVLTDGEDSSITELVSELNRAATLGIRVAFGFLSQQPPASEANLLTAILQTGGIYSTINSAEAQQNFVNLVLAHGATDQDSASGAANGTGFLLPGLTVAGNVSSSSGPKTFTYNAQAGEKLNFTVSTVGGGKLDVALRDVGGSKDISTTSTDAKGEAFLTFDAPGALQLGLAVSTTNASTSLFTVGLNSSLSVGNFTCGIPIPPPTNTSTPLPNGTIPSTPTLPPVFTGGSMSGVNTPHWFTSLALFSVAYLVCAFAGFLQ